MSIRSLIILSMVLPATVAIVACSSAPPPGPPAKTNTDTSGNEPSATNTQDVTSTPSATVTAPPKPVVIDAGVPDSGDLTKTPTPVQGPPQPTTHFCSQLSQCCGSLSTFQALACTGTAIAGDETACGVELAVCKAGGIDFGGIFGGGGDDDTTTF